MKYRLFSILLLLPFVAAMQTASPIIFQEADGSPKVTNPAKVIFPNNSLTRSNNLLTFSGTGNATITAKTTGYSVLGTDAGTIFTNTGAGGGVNFTLPTASAGLQYIFYRDANQTITITAGASTTIRVAATQSATAGNVTLDAVGSSLTLISISATQWVAVASTGTLTVN